MLRSLEPDGGRRGLGAAAWARRSVSCAQALNFIMTNQVQRDMKVRVVAVVIE
jgi:hypothetical protein